MEKKEILKEESARLKTKLKNSIILFIILSIIVLISLKLNTNKISKSDLEDSKYKCENYVPVEAILNENYKQLKISKRTIDIDINEFSYTYIVNSNEYKAKITSTSKVPENVKINVWYNKENPTLNETENPCDIYNKIKDKKISKFSNILFYSTMIVLLILVYLLFSIISTIGKVFFNKLESKIHK